MTNHGFDATEHRAMHEQNRRSWNAVTSVHNIHKQDQAGFLRGGGSTLFPDELELLGEVAGKRIVHLQCNCGQDTLSLAALGAEVLGVDIADDAIAFAERLAGESGIAARFLRSDLFDWFATTEETFDVAFTTYGGIGWLCNLDTWAQGVARVLAPGGHLVLLEFHPLVYCYGPGGTPVDPYFIDGAIREDDGVKDYVGSALAPSGYTNPASDFQNPEPSVSFQWTVADIVQAVVDAGLRIEVLREYPYANGCELFPGMEPLPGRRFGMPEGQPAMPLMLGLRARR